MVFGGELSIYDPGHRNRGQVGTMSMATTSEVVSEVHMHVLQRYGHDSSQVHHEALQSVRAMQRTSQGEEGAARD